MPATLAPETFTDVTVQNAYALAAKIKKVLYQQPCYCYCDRHAGHGSLLDCYTGKHAADCGVCLREGLYAYEQTKKGKNRCADSRRNRKGRMATVDMTKYQTPISGESSEVAARRLAKLEFHHELISRQFSASSAARGCRTPYNSAPLMNVTPHIST